MYCKKGQVNSLNKFNGQPSCTCTNVYMYSSVMPKMRKLHSNSKLLTKEWNKVHGITFTLNCWPGQDFNRAPKCYNYYTYLWNSYNNGLLKGNKNQVPQNYKILLTVTMMHTCTCLSAESFSRNYIVFM